MKGHQEEIGLKNYPRSFWNGMAGWCRTNSWGRRDNYNWNWRGINDIEQILRSRGYKNNREKGLSKRWEGKREEDE